MPRRWTNNTHRPRKPEVEQAPRPKSYEAMAKALVRAGKASPAILSGSNAKYREDND